MQAAVRLQSFRTHFQVQTSLGIHLGSEESVWKRIARSLDPTSNAISPVRPDLLNLIVCNYKVKFVAACYF